MKHKTLLIGMVLILVGLVILQFILDGGRTDNVATAPEQSVINASDDPQMQEAYDKARKSLDYFLKTAASAPQDTRGFALRVGVRDDGMTEFFWVYPFQEEEEGFSGRINSEPALVDSVFKGEIIHFDRGQIVDWTFEDRATGIMHGNFTGCVQLAREAPEHAEQFQELYGLDCSR